MEEMRVEEVGEARRGDRGDRAGLVGEGRDKANRLEGEVVGLGTRDGCVWRLEVLCEPLDALAGIRGLRDIWSVRSGH